MIAELHGLKLIGPVTKTMINMNVGESRLLPEGAVSSVNRVFVDSRKQVARRYLGDPNANWSARTTTKGIRITRTA